MPKDFQLAYVVTLAEHELSTDIHVSNPSASEALDFQALLHTYIRAPANEVSISPLLGRRYIDKMEKSVQVRNTLKEATRLAFSPGNCELRPRLSCPVFRHTGSHAPTNKQGS